MKIIQSDNTSSFSAVLESIGQPVANEDIIFFLESREIDSPPHQKRKLSMTAPVPPLKLEAPRPAQTEIRPPRFQAPSGKTPRFEIRRTNPERPEFNINVLREQTGGYLQYLGEVEKKQPETSTPRARKLKKI